LILVKVRIISMGDGLLMEAILLMTSTLIEVDD
jgi:hypothetical protein